MPTEKAVEPYPREPLVEPQSGEVAWNWGRFFERWRSASPKIETYQQTLDPAAVAANTSAEQTFTVTGLATTDIILVNKPSLSAGTGIVNARCSAADTLAITFMNSTGGAIDPPSESYLIVAIRL